MFDAALAPLGGRKFSHEDRHIDFLYFDTYGGQSPPEHATIGFQLINRQRTMMLDNKAKMAAVLHESNVNTPRVLFDPQSVPTEPETLWFIKNPMLSGGKGIHVVRRHEIADKFQPGFIIQEAIRDLLLIQQRKFTLRGYVLAHGGKLYLFPRAITILHGAAYNRDSQEDAVQFQHTGYMDADSEVKMTPFELGDRQSQVMGSLKAMIPSVFGLFSDYLKYEKADTYCLFGIDALVTSDLNTVLIEINDRPNLVHPRVVNEQVNVPMVRALFCVLNPSSIELLHADAPRFELLVTL